MNEPYKFYEQSADYVRARMPFAPQIAVILGSSLGPFAKRLQNTVEIDYHDIPNFPVSTAPGHAGRFVFGYVEETPVVVMQGRVHLYEGYTPHDVVLPVRLMKAMGAKILFVTNASGGIRGDLTAGTLMSISDHISALIPNPLIGANIDELGVRFPDMSNAYDKGLRAILRQDPDIISVGEIRDGETASIAMRAAITGHLVLSTLHTNDAPSAVDRLRDVGVEPWLISGALRGVVSQRLVRRICPHCKRAYHPASDELALLGLDDAPDLVFYKGAGCPDCHHTGYTGRRAVFEILMLDAPLRRLITAGASADELADEARRHGFTTMRERCRDLVLRGETTAEEAARTISSTIES